MREKTGKRYLIVMLLLAAGCFFLNPSLIWAQKLTHTVQKGDTLWDICDHYYGDPDLWPKLWQMNPFITNPHLLRPGDVITLFEQEPVKEAKKVEEQPPAVEEPVKKEVPKSQVMGVDVGHLTNLDSIGFLSHEKIESWGTLFASDNDRIMLSEGDTAYILFDKDKTVKVGDEFTIGRSSAILKNPVTGRNLGYVFKVKGKVKVQERLGLAYGDKRFYNKENVFLTKIVKSNEPINIDDSVLPRTEILPCVVPVSLNKNILANIVASKGQVEMIGSNNIVYIDLGLNDGINRGNVFEVVEGNVVPDPNPGTEASSSKIILPDKRLGKIMILEARADTSTAIVLSATKDFSPGVYITNLSWAEMPDYLSSIASCPAE
jgi:LysM domain